MAVTGPSLMMITGLFVGFRADPAEHVRLDELTVGRLNIAGPDSVQRIIMSHVMPQAPFQGEMLERSVPPGLAGIIYCAPNGDEVGGVGVMGSEEGGAALFALDYRNTPLEAIGMVTRYEGEEQSASLVIMDPPRGQVDIKKIKANDAEEVKRLQDMMVNRIDLTASVEGAMLTIMDSDGDPRIMIGVDANDEPVISILDKEGKVVGKIPAAPVTQK